MGAGPRIDKVATSVYRVPLGETNRDGTCEWDSVTAVVVEVAAGEATGLGWTYGHTSAADLVTSLLSDRVLGSEVMSTGRIWRSMADATRNLGRPGIASTAISAVDIALWDVKARLLGVPLSALLGSIHDAVAVYGSGGFCNQDRARLAAQLAGWADEGCAAVKMKVGAEPHHDVERATIARDAIGPDVDLMVDANGAYGRNQALRLSRHFADRGVTWFEEPVPSDDLRGLAAIRAQTPIGMEVAAGEYGWDPWQLQHLVDAEAIDVLQVDVTRCGGYTGFLSVAGACHATHTPLSTHGAPQLSLHVAGAAPTARHIEWFVDHVKVERMLFDGVVESRSGWLAPDPGRPGHGLELRTPDASEYRVAS